MSPEGVDAESMTRDKKCGAAAEARNFQEEDCNRMYDMIQYATVFPSGSGFNRLPER